MGRVFFNTRKHIQSLTAAHTVLASDSNTTFILNAAAGVAITLPSAADMGEGWHCRFLVGTLFATSDWTITATAAVIKGGINELEVDTGDDGAATTGSTTLTLEKEKDVLGDYIDLMCDGTTIYLSGQLSADAGLTFS